MSSKPYSKLARKSSERRRSDGKLQTAFALIGELGKASEMEVAALHRRIDLLAGRVGALEHKRPWWKVWG